MDLGQLKIVGDKLSIYLPLVGGFDESDPRTEAEIDQQVDDLINYINQNNLAYTHLNEDLEIEFDRDWLDLKQLFGKIHQIIDYIQKYNLPYIISQTVFIEFFNNRIKGILTINSSNIISLVYRAENGFDLIEEQYPLMVRKTKM